jgi:hypothetical protein
MASAPEKRDRQIGKNIPSKFHFLSDEVDKQLPFWLGWTREQLQSVHRFKPNASGEFEKVDCEQLKNTVNSIPDCDMTFAISDKELLLRFFRRKNPAEKDDPNKINQSVRYMIHKSCATYFWFSFYVTGPQSLLDLLFTQLPPPQAYANNEVCCGCNFNMSFKR